VDAQYSFQFLNGARLHEELSIYFTCDLPIVPVGFTQTSSIPATPATAKHLVIDRYFGDAVTDDYRWLENWTIPQ